jgi:pimeloyl-ACP methyl ester carboxylesterase
LNCFMPIEVETIAGVPCTVQGPVDATTRVLALHGWGRSKNDWIAARQDIRIFSIDLPGHGNSPPPSGAWGAREYAKWLEPILAEIGRCVVVGHSFGGRVALCAAAVSPELVEGLVLSGVPIFRSAKRSSSSGLRFRKRLNLLGIYSDERLDRFRFERGSSDYKAVTGVMRDVFVRTVNEDYSAEVAMVECPILFFWGEDDSAVPLATAITANSLVNARSRLVVCQGDHFAVLTSSHFFWDQVVKMFVRGN